MTTDQTDAPVLLDAIERAALAAADADMILRGAARDAGVPISAIADAAGGVARSTIYQWTVERGAGRCRNRVYVLGILRRALRAGGGGGVHERMARVAPAGQDAPGPPRDGHAFTVRGVT